MAADGTDHQTPPAVAYIVRSYPRLSQTFVLNEIRALERLGVSLRVFAITDPREPVTHPEVAEVRAPAHYLDGPGRTWWSTVSAHLSAGIGSPRRYVNAWIDAVHAKGSDSGYRVASRYLCLHYAVTLAAALKLVARLTHRLTGIPFSFTAHARDLYQVPEAELRARAEQATAIVTCCRANVDFLSRVLPSPLCGKVLLVHHGVDLHEFRPREPDGAASGAPLLLSVGRLVEKKGFADLLAACHRLRRSGRRFRCRIYGDGPE